MPCCPQAALAHGRRRPNVAVLLFACLATVTRAAENSGLLQALEAASSEEAAKALLDPHLDSLKELDREVIEKVVLRQWWGLARDIVARSHLQQVDLSFSVRKAVRTLKDEADELLRTLNPKYGLAQQVSPAFQWAQNDTCIFLTIKYTVRWNAPGALEVTEPSVNITDNMFNFTGLGKHSNNKYKYWLTLNLFDRLSVAHSTWSMASVGKMSATLRKRWPRKWPRLLLDKKQKIGNMHVWMEMQDKLDSSLSGMSSATNSPMTCMQAEKLYCLPTDTCKKSVNCSTCPGKNTPHEEEGVCTGMPSEKASVSFKDADMDANEIGGDVKISKARNEFDIERYVLYFGKDDHTPIEYENGARAVLGEARPTGFDTEVAVEQNTKIPAEATHLLVYSKNAFGEYPSPGSTVLRDAVLPKGKPGPITFEDDDGEKGEVSGVVRIARAENEDKLDDYSLHWGRSATRKTSSSSLIRDISKGSSGQTDIAHTISRSTRPPEGATHLLVFAKNEFGENPSPSSLKFVDNVKACLTPMDADCVVAVEVTADEDETASKAKATIKVVPAKEQVNMTAYVVYWGKKACEPGESSTGVKNGLIKELPVSGPLEHQLVDAKVPPHTTHIVAFSKNRYGESLFCVSVPFQDVKPAPAEPEDKKAEL